MAGVGSNEEPFLGAVGQRRRIAGPVAVGRVARTTDAQQKATAAVTTKRMFVAAVLAPTDTKPTRKAAPTSRDRRAQRRSPQRVNWRAAVKHAAMSAEKPAAATARCNTPCQLIESGAP